MSPFWLAHADPATAWAHQAWSELASRTDRDNTVVVFPIHGFADHGMALPLDIEETVGSAVLRAAVEALAGAAPVLVLPPLRLCLAPYPHTFFGVDPETALASLREIAAGVKAAGFAKLVFFNTSPWNAELLSTAALDLRVHQDLYPYLIGSAGIGLGFHPAAETRRETQAVAVSLLGKAPAGAPRPAEVRDPDFRPGHYAQPAPVAFDASLDGPALLTAAAERLAGLLAEITAHRLPDRPMPAPKPVVPAAGVLWPACRPRTLAALTHEELEAIPNKSSALVIVTTGAIEQHGHHLPLGTDAILGQIWLARALAKLPADAPVYVAPPITYGKSEEHADFAGTLTLSAATLRRQLLALATQVKALGFRQLAILNTHGGNSAVVVATVREIQTGLGLRAGLLSGYYKPAQHAQEAAFGFHAGEWETSLLLADAPDLVHMDRAVCEYPARFEDPGLLRPEAAAAVFAWKTRDLSQSGVMGNATLATAEKGRRWLDEASAALAQKIASLLA
jgi:creatinine amidohydrolase